MVRASQDLSLFSHVCVCVCAHTYALGTVHKHQTVWLEEEGQSQGKAARPGIYSLRSRRKEVAAKIAWVGWCRVGCRQYYYGVDDGMAGVGLKEHF